MLREKSVYAAVQPRGLARPLTMAPRLVLLGAMNAVTVHFIARLLHSGRPELLLRRARS